MVFHAFLRKILNYSFWCAIDSRELLVCAIFLFFVLLPTLQPRHLEKGKQFWYQGKSGNGDSTQQNDWTIATIAALGFVSPRKPVCLLHHCHGTRRVQKPGCNKKTLKSFRFSRNRYEKLWKRNIESGTQATFRPSCEVFAETRFEACTQQGRRQMSFQRKFCKSS